jgi:pyruvate/2-oxoglutarate dehydrogenase complex dihydrolipoamide acyltransferase (E2) component
LESDKAAMEIPASVIGKVISIDVSIGDTVTSGFPFLKIEVSEDTEHQVEEDPHDDQGQEKQTVPEKKGTD